MKDEQAPLTEAWSGLLASLANQAGTPPDPTDALPKLYERWFRRDTWLVLDEAVPLLAGLDPEQLSRIARADAAVDTARQALHAALGQAIRSGKSLRVQNPEATDAAWTVTPTDTLPWAQTLRLPVPAAFENLARFILLTVRTPDQMLPPQVTATDTAQVRNRERVLGAALNLLAKSPADCRDALGLVSGELIVGLLKAQSFRWFDAAEPPMADAEMAELIDRWLE